MINNKLYLSGNYNRIPNNSLVKTRNVQFNDDFEFLINEKGFDNLHTFSENICGVIPIDTKAVIFTTDNNGVDCIYLVNESTKSLCLKGNLSLSTDNPIKGKYQINNKGELIVVFNDGNAPTSNPIRVFNIDNPYMELDPVTKEFINEEDGLNKLLLNPNFKHPSFILDDSNQNDKGSLAKGVYHIVISYYIGDFDRLNWSIPSLPYSIFKTSKNTIRFGSSDPDAPSGFQYRNVIFDDYFQTSYEDNSNSSFEVTINNLDTNYAKYKLALIHRTETSVKVYDMGDFETSVSYHNITSISETELSIEEVTIPYINFGKVGDLTISLDRLTVINTETNGLIDYQKFANNIKVTYRLSDTELLGDVIKINARTPMPDDVYALNIGLVGLDGTVKGVFHIPGRAPIQFNPTYGEDSDITPTEKATYNTNNGRNVPEAIEINKYFQLYNTADSAANSDRFLGFWENETETYPNIDQFEVWDVDVNGDPVYLDTLVGKKVRHHKMPDLEKIDGLNSPLSSKTNMAIELNFEDIKFPASILSQIQGFFIAYSVRNSNNCTVLGFHPLIRNDFYSAPNSSKDDYTKFRFNDMSLLKYKPAISKPYLKGLYTTNDILHQASVMDYEGATPIWYIPSTVYSNGLNSEIRKVTDYKYLPKNNSATFPTNKGREESLMLTVNNGFNDNTDTLVCALKSNITDVYKPFNQNKVAIASKVTPIQDGVYSYTLEGVNGFDCFVSKYWDILYRGDQTLYLDEDGGLDRENSGTAARSDVISAIECLSYGLVNTNLKSKSNDDITLGADFLELNSSSFSFKKPTGLSYTGNINTDPTKDFGIEYNKMYSYGNTLVNYFVYNYNNVFVNSHPHRVARSAIQSKESLTLNWRYFSALEYYEMEKHRGIGVALEAIDKLLLIHMEHSLYVAQGKDKISIPEGDAYIGSADIFDRKPDELLVSNKGTAGIQSRFANVVGDIGYIFADSYDKSIYIYSNGKLDNITDDTVRSIFKKYMKVSNGNPLTGIDVAIGIDHENKRIIISNIATTKFTLSYCYDHRTPGWVSLHDYVPAKMFNHRLGSYSINSSYLKQLYKFNSEVIDRGVYYNATKYESYIDVLINDNPNTNKILNSIGMQSGVDDNANNINKLFFYSRNQCSKVYTLAEFTSIEDYDKIRFLEGYWFYDAIRDYSSDAIVQSIVDEFGNINMSAIDESKNWWELSDINGKYFIVRLIVNNNTPVVFRDLIYDLSLSNR